MTYSNDALDQSAPKPQGSRRRTTNKVRVVLVHPKGAILPPEINIKQITAVNLLDRLHEGSGDAVSLIELSAREAELISTFSDVFGLDFMVLTGLPNAQYDTVWNMYTATFERISLDTLPAFIQGINDIAGTPVVPELSPEDLGELG